MFTKSKLDRIREKMIKNNNLCPNKEQSKINKCDNTIKTIKTTSDTSVSLVSEISGTTGRREEQLSSFSSTSSKKRRIETVKTRLRFKIPKPTEKISVDIKEERMEVETLPPSMPTSHKGQLVPTDSKSKNWNVDTNNMTIDDVKASLVHDFNKHYDQKFGKFPSRARLASRGFGHPSKKHCFTSEVIFDHILVVIYKSNYLSHSEVTILNKCHLLYEHLYKTLQRTMSIDFRDINVPDPNYMDQTEVSREKQEKFLAAALYYDLHLGSVMRYAGDNYTGEFRDVDYIMSQIKGIAPDEICDNVKKLLTTGAPHEMHGHSTHENFTTYKEYGNHKSILLKPEKIKKVMHKENKYCYAMAFPSWIARFVPNMHLTPQGLVVKPGKNDRLIFDASIKLEWDSYNINMATDNSTAPKIYYGDKFRMHLQRIWNLRISFPLLDIYLWDDDVSGAFRQGKYNPEVAAAFCFIIFGILWLPCGQTFGGNTSPHCYEPLANAREYLAKHFSHKRFSYLIKKHWD